MSEIIKDFKQRWKEAHFLDRFHDQVAKKDVKDARLQATYIGDQVFHSKTTFEAESILKKEPRSDAKPTVRAGVMSQVELAGALQASLPNSPAAKKGAGLFGLFRAKKPESEKSLQQKAENKNTFPKK